MSRATERSKRGKNVDHHGREFLGTVMCFLSDSFFIFPMSFVAYIHRCPQGVGIAFSEVVLSIQLSQTDRVGRVQYTG